jgi:hypothetical protein
VVGRQFVGECRQLTGIGVDRDAEHAVGPGLREAADDQGAAAGGLDHGVRLRGNQLGGGREPAGIGPIGQVGIRCGHGGIGGQQEGETGGEAGFDRDSALHCGLLREGYSGFDASHEPQLPPRNGVP